MADVSSSTVALTTFFAKADTAIRLVKEVHARHPFHGCINAATLGLSLSNQPAAVSLEMGLPEQQDLAYISPEQTGRMNRAVDYRSDYYSLGVVFYELLTARLPFVTDDMMELVHSHIARQPAAPHQLQSRIPRPVSDIVMKLLSKNAEDRYQSLEGLAADLAHCRQVLNDGRRLTKFALGKNDVFNRLSISEKLYGRESELKRLLDAFKRTADGAAEILLVSGYSGIGKSSLVNSIQPAIREKHGIYLSGKFDQFKRNIPYATLAQAFQGFMLQILGESEAGLARWRDEVLKAVGSNGQLLIDLIPALELVIGKQPATITLTSTEAQNRLQLVFHQFVRVLAQADHPLVLFVDDLQWIDAASLKLLEHLLNQPDMQHLLLIGAYRDNEVDSSHPLMLGIASLRKRAGVVHEIRLAPLTLANMNRMIADSLHCPPERTMPLADLVFQKTEGNPFFTRQFLNTLYEEKLLAFDTQPAQAATWHWDVELIKAKDITDNVVELMVGKLQRLSKSSLDVLQCLACLGNSATISVLATVAGLTEKETEANLEDVFRYGFLLHLSRTLKFAHDRIQEAAYSLIPDEQKAALHLAAGRLLMAHLDAAELDGSVFDVVHQLNRGAHLVTDEQEKRQICRLNAVAGKKAKDSAAYASARDYLVHAIALLPKDCWELRFNETFALYLDCAECELVLNHFQETDALLDVCLVHAQRPRDRAKVYFLRNRMYYITKRANQGLDAGLQTLQLFGVTFPATEDALRMEGEAARQRLSDRLALHQRPIAELIDLPVVTDPDVHIIIALMAEMVTATYSARPALALPLLARAMEFCLEHGNIEESCVIYSNYGLMLAGSFDDQRTGYELSQMALRLNERFQDVKLQGRLIYIHSYAFNGMQQALATGIPMLEQGFISCREMGNQNFMAANAAALCWLKWETGKTLNGVLQTLQPYLDMARQTHLEIAQFLTGMIEFAAMQLQGTATAEQQQKCEALFNWALEAQYGYGIGHYHITKQVEHYLFGRFGESLEAANLAETIMPSSLRALAPMVTHHFYHALALTALYPQGDAAQQEAARDQLYRLLHKLKLWSDSCPGNYANRFELVSAEIARIEGRDMDAMRHYEAAIRSARENGFVQNEALANELAGLFYTVRGLATNAAAHLQNARAQYLRWGAFAKVTQFDKQHPQYAIERRETDVFSNRIDSIAILKAYQAISGEIVLAKLLRTMMNIVIETAGAEQAHLLLMRDGALQVVAEVTIRDNTPDILLLAKPIAVDTAALPERVVSYVVRTRETVLFSEAADGTHSSLFASDPYIQNYAPRSLLCLPILKQGSLVGVLYLENRLAAGAFTPGHIAVLEMLASQAAISLENAALYTELEQRVEERTRSLSAEVKERKQAQTHLKQTLTELELVLENASLGISTVVMQPNGDRIIKTVNQAFARMLGYEIADFIGNSTRMLFLNPEQYDKVRLAYDQVLHTGSTYRHEHLYRRKDGTPVLVALVGTAIDPDDFSKGTIWLCEDVTERKRIESELISTKEIAEAATKSKSEFLANMSHEIRTPMNAIIGMSYLALRTELDKQQRDYVDKIHGAAVSLLGVINDILDFSKIEAGKMSMERTDFSLDDVLKNIATVTSGKAHDKGLEYLFQIPPSVPRRLVGDPLRLGQVLINLVNNAVKFTTAGEVCVACRQLESTSDNRVLLEFSVRDTGIGMTPEQTAKLFRAFSQADESTTRKYGGTGLGLSISKAIVEKMNGTIDVHSTLDQGSTFQFTAWFELGQQQETEKDLPLAINGMHILVVDDNAAARTIMQENFSQWPVIVDLASGGVEALELIRKADAARPYDVVFTDLRMPQMDGVDLIHAVKNGRLHAPPRMVLMSVHGMEEMTQTEGSELADAMLTKPINPSQLIDNLVDVAAPSSRMAPANRINVGVRFDDLTILLVEDNEINQQIARELLQAVGITVELAGNGRIAVERLKQVGPNHYGLVFMDVQMPEMDGHEASRAIRSDERFAKLPIIAMTAHAMIEERERCVASGMNDHVSKPINPTELYQAIVRWCPQCAEHASEKVVAPPSADDAVGALTIDGVDVTDGLQRMLGNRRFYLEMLDRFRADHGDTVTRIRTALRSADERLAAERNAHTLKAVSGQLGINGVAAIAERLEQEIHAGASQKKLMPLLEKLDSEMKSLLHALVRVFAHAGGKQTDEPAAFDMDRDTLHALLIRIADLLSQYDVEAIDLLSDSKRILATSLGHTVQQKIAQAAHVYNFDDALAALKKGAESAGYAIPEAATSEPKETAQP